MHVQGRAVLQADHGSADRVGVAGAVHQLCLGGVLRAAGESDGGLRRQAVEGQQAAGNAASQLAAGAVQVHRHVAGEGFDIAREVALGFAETDTDADHLAAVVGELDVGIADEERVDRAGGVVDRAQGEVVDGDVGTAGKLAAAVVLAQLQLLHVQLGLDVGAEVDAGEVQSVGGVGGEVDEGLADHVGKLVVVQRLHPRLGGGSQQTGAAEQRATQQEGQTTGHGLTSCSSRGRRQRHCDL